MTLGSMPGAQVIVADDASHDGTAHFAWAHGAQVVRTHKSVGKGLNVTNALFSLIAAMPADDPDSPPRSAELEDIMRTRRRWEFDDEAVLGIPSQVMPLEPELDFSTVVLLCDADLEISSERLVDLVEAVERDECDVAIAKFGVSQGGGFGITQWYAKRRIEELCGFRAEAPISGQRAMRLSTLWELLPFADDFGMELGMTVDAVRAGYRLTEIELPLEHRETGRTPAGFLHRARQLRDIRRAASARR
jgi:hypothetical protein